MSLMRRYGGHLNNWVPAPRSTCKNGFRVLSRIFLCLVDCHATVQDSWHIKTGVIISCMQQDNSYLNKLR